MIGHRRRELSAPPPPCIASPLPPGRRRQGAAGGTRSMQVRGCVSWTVVVDPWGWCLRACTSCLVSERSLYCLPWDCEELVPSCAHCSCPYPSGRARTTAPPGRWPLSLSQKLRKKRDLQPPWPVQSAGRAEVGLGHAQALACFPSSLARAARAPIHRQFPAQPLIPCRLSPTSLSLSLLGCARTRPFVQGRPTG